MREIEASVIRDAIEELCISANKILPEDVESAMRRAAKRETDPLPMAVMKDLCDNLDAARELDIPVCQDTGMAVVFAEIGQEVHIKGSFEEAVNEGVRRGYLNGLLRCSVVADPIRRGNTGDNTPFGFHALLQIRHLFIAALFKAGKHIFKATAFILPASLPFIITRPICTGAGTGTVESAGTAGPLRRRRRALRRFHCFFHGKAHLSIVTDT